MHCRQVLAVGATLAGPADCLGVVETPENWSFDGDSQSPPDAAGVEPAPATPLRNAARLPRRTLLS